MNPNPFSSICSRDLFANMLTFVEAKEYRSLMCVNNRCRQLTTSQAVLIRHQLEYLKFCRISSCPPTKTHSYSCKPTTSFSVPLPGTLLIGETLHFIGKDLRIKVGNFIQGLNGIGLFGAGNKYVVLDSQSGKCCSFNSSTTMLNAFFLSLKEIISIFENGSISLWTVDFEEKSVKLTASLSIEMEGDHISNAVLVNGVLVLISQNKLIRIRCTKDSLKLLADDFPQNLLILRFAYQFRVYGDLLYVLQLAHISHVYCYKVSHDGSFNLLGSHQITAKENQTTYSSHYVNSWEVCAQAIAIDFESTDNHQRKGWMTVLDRTASKVLQTYKCQQPTETRTQLYLFPNGLARVKHNYISLWHLSSKNSVVKKKVDLRNIAHVTLNRDNLLIYGRQNKQIVVKEFTLQEYTEEKEIRPKPKKQRLLKNFRNDSSNSYKSQGTGWKNDPSYNHYSFH